MARSQGGDICLFSLLLSSLAFRFGGAEDPTLKPTGSLHLTTLVDPSTALISSRPASFSTQAHICVNTGAPHCDRPSRMGARPSGKGAVRPGTARASARREAGGFTRRLTTGKARAGEGSEEKHTDLEQKESAGWAGRSHTNAQRLNI